LEAESLFQEGVRGCQHIMNIEKYPVDLENGPELKF